MKKTKASRIQDLSYLVTVPDFYIIQRGDSLLNDYDETKEYMIRSSADMEDNERYSHAGEFDTFGPLKVQDIPENIAKVFQNRMVSEVIVQEFAPDLIKGVAFCFNEEDIYIEYSKVAEGVTSGKIRPFVAVLPANIRKYGLLYSEILRIYKKFGPGDIEFCGIEDPVFLQFRPITHKFRIDREMANLKMNLQELREDRWIENDFCRVLAEKKGSGEYIKLYVEALKRVFLDCFGREPDISEEGIIKISGQFFMTQEFEEKIRPTIWELTRFGFGFMRRFSEIKSRYDIELDTVKLLENSLMLSYGYDILRNNSIFIWREKYRRKIEKMINEDKEADFHSRGKLRNCIEKDSAKMIWAEIGYYDGDGTEVVSGDFQSGPYFHLDDRRGQIPDNVILVTSQLFPEIGHKMKNLKGIICENGSLNSHIAILAREYSVPLKIQVSDINKYR